MTDQAEAAVHKRPRRVLVLNADYRPLNTWPLSVVSVEDAVLKLFKERVDVVEEWDEVLRSPSVEIRVPKVMVLKEYQHVDSAPKFCRRSVYLRDRYCCQYCGERFPEAELTFDHVIPRDKGGKTVWDNILTCCVACNAAKKNSLPNFSGRRGQVGKGNFRPLKAPYRPTAAELLRNGLELLPDDLREDFGSWLYHEVELRP